MNDIEKSVTLRQDRWKLVDYKGDHLFLYVKNLISDKYSESRIGICLELNLKDSITEDFGIIKGDKYYKNIVNGNELVLFKYNSIRVFLFETGVGFLVYSVEFGEKGTCSISDTVNGNYYFKKFDQRDTYESYDFQIDRLNDKMRNEEAKSKDSGRACGFKEHIQREITKLKSAGDLQREEQVRRILRSLDLDVDNYFTSVDRPNYGHVFSYVNFDSTVEVCDVGNCMHWLKNEYKQQEQKKLLDEKLKAREIQRDNDGCNSYSSCANIDF